MRAAPVTWSTVVVAVDVGKTSVALSVTDVEWRRLLGPMEFVMTRSALSAAAGQIRRGSVALIEACRAGTPIRASVAWSEVGCEFIERSTDPAVRRVVDDELVVAAAEVLHERVASSDGLR